MTIVSRHKDCHGLNNKMKQPTNNKTIAKNTIFLYFRMMVTMLVTLYTSRVVLQVLGVEDFGLYAVVGGVVGMLSFLNSTLSGGSSRFLTFELGTGNVHKLQKTFSTLLNMHIILAIIIIVLAETVGLWFVYNKAGIPPERMNAAVWVFHISVLTAVISMIQVPYNASIIAHEKMKVFAYISIVEVSLKLGVVYLLKFGNLDKLVFYAILICIVTICIALFYCFYCRMNYKETHYKLILDKEILKSVGSFSGWNLLGNASYTLTSQGTNIIINMFFSPAVVTARAIAVQVDMAAMQFVQNFRTAANPQIIKKYAAEDYDGSKQLLIDSTKFSFFLMLLLGLPIILLAEPLLQLWLGQVPEYSVIFLKLIVIESLFTVFSISFNAALYAKGQMKENALITPLFGFIRFPVTYFLFKAGFSPVVLSYAGIISYALLGLLVKPILVCKIVDYSFRDMLSIFIPCLKVSLIAFPAPMIVNYYYSDNNLLCFVVIALVSVLCVAASVFYFGINGEMRRRLIEYAKQQIRINKN